MRAPRQGRRLDRRVNLLRAVTTTDEFNVPEASSWRVFARGVPAAYMPLSDGERLRAAEVAASIDARFVVRWSAATAAITAKDRLEFDGRTFNISGVKDAADEDGRALRRRFLEISAQARSE